MQPIDTLRPLLDAFEEGVLLLDAAGTVRSLNTAAEQLLGYRPAELIGHPILSSLVGPAEEGQLQADAATDRDWRAPFRRDQVQLRHRNGGSLSALCTLQPPLHLAGMDLELLKLRPRERKPVCAEALRDSQAKLRAILETVTDGILVIDEKGIIELFTPGAERLFGYRADEVLGQNVKLLMPSPYREAHDGYLEHYRNTGIGKIIGVGREVMGLRKDGTIFPLYLSVGELHLEGRRLFVGVTHDLTQRKHTEERLLTLSAAMDQSPAAVLIADRNGTLQYVNAAFTRLTGYGADEVVGQDLRAARCGPPQPIYRHLADAMADGRERRGEVQGRSKHGDIYWAQETITPLRNGQGEISHYLLVQEDITQQKQDKEALAESEARARHVAEMAGEWLWEQDPEGHYIYSSGAVQDILGFTPSEVQGRHYFALLTDEDRHHWNEALPFLAAGPPRPFHRLINRYRHKDGHEVYTESTGTPIFDEAGRLIKWLGVDRDITASKTYEDALRIRDRAIEAASVGIVITDARAPGNPNIYVNPALSRITGYSREELLGNNMRVLQGPDTEPAAIEQIRRAIAEGVGTEVVLTNYRKDGTPFWNELLISPVFDETGRLTHYIGIQTDVTERRRAEEDRHELEMARHIQLSLLPSAPLRLPGAEVAGVCVPATHVGGDYFDYFDASGALGIVIADVSGHSIGAALIMAEVRSTLRAEARRAFGLSVGPGQVLHDLNALLHDDLCRSEMFITMFYLKYHVETRTLRYANAGHNEALLLRAGSMTCTPLDTEGLILGVIREVEFEEKTIQLHPGDRILLYTDGITEAQNPQGEFFGTARLCNAFHAHRALPPQAQIDRLHSELRAYCGNVPLADDISMMVLQVR